MPTNISIKNVPDKIVDVLRQRAKRHHRSLQGELMALLEEVALTGPRSVNEAELKLSGLGISTGDEATRWLRELRDAR
jgi:plasmid stability protein